MSDEDAIRMPELPDETETLASPPEIESGTVIDPAATHVYRHVACGGIAFGLYQAPMANQNIMGMKRSPDIRPVTCLHCGQVLVQLHPRHVSVR